MALRDYVINVLQRAVNRIAGSSLNNGYYRGGFLTGPPERNMPVYPDAKIETFLRAYKTNASVYSIVNLAARKFSVVPRYLMKEEDEQYVKQDKVMSKSGTYRKSVKTKAYTAAIGVNRDLDMLLSRPNPAQGQDAFFFAVYAWFALSGECFVWLNRGDITDGATGGNFLEDSVIDKMPVLEMWALPTHLVEIIPNDDWTVDHYTLQVNGALLKIRKNDIIHWKKFTTDWDSTTRYQLRGHAPLASGWKILSMDEDSTDAAVAMYQHGGARGILFEKSLKNISATQKAQIEEITAKRINNKDLKSSIANLQGDWGYHDIGQSSVDLQLLDGKDKAFAMLCHVFGVPPGLFLIDQTYENQRSNRKRFLSELIIPDCTSFNDEMNRMLLPAFGLKGYRIEPDYSELPEMQEDTKDLITSLLAAPVTPNEVREAIGYDKLNIPGMDTVYIGGMPVEDLGIDKELNENDDDETDDGDRAKSNGTLSHNGQRKKLPV